MNFNNVRAMSVCTLENSCHYSVKIGNDKKNFGYHPENDGYILLAVAYRMHRHFPIVIRSFFIFPIFSKLYIAEIR